MHDTASLCKGDVSQNIQLIDVSSMPVSVLIFSNLLSAIFSCTPCQNFCE